jgi:TetR/AcrR family transcriptional regulator
MQAAEQIFAEYGYHGARLRQIAAAVGIQKASLFHHFPGKEELYRAILEESAADIGEALGRAVGVGGPFDERLRLLVSTYVDLVAERPAHTRMLLRQCLERSPAAAAGRPELEPLFALVVDFIGEGQRARSFRTLDPAALVLSVVGVTLFFFAAAPLIAPRWTAEKTARGEFAETVKRYVTEMAERMLLLDAEQRPVGPRLRMA